MCELQRRPSIGLQRLSSNAASKTSGAGSTVASRHHLGGETDGAEHSAAGGTLVNRPRPGDLLVLRRVSSPAHQRSAGRGISEELTCIGGTPSGRGQWVLCGSFEIDGPCGRNGEEHECDESSVGTIGEKHTMQRSETEKHIDQRADGEKPPAQRNATRKHSEERNLW